MRDALDIPSRFSPREMTSADEQRLVDAERAWSALQRRVEPVMKLCDLLEYGDGEWLTLAFLAFDQVRSSDPRYKRIWGELQAMKEEVRNGQTPT